MVKISFSVQFSEQKYSFDVRRHRNIASGSLYKNDSLNKNSVRDLATKFEILGTPIYRQLKAYLLDVHAENPELKRVVKFYAHLTCFEVRPLLDLTQPQVVDYTHKRYLKSGKLTSHFFDQTPSDEGSELKRIKALQRRLEGLRPVEAINFFEELIEKCVTNEKSLQASSFLRNKHSLILTYLTKIKQYSSTFYEKNISEMPAITFEQLPYSTSALSGASAAIIVQTPLYKHAMYTSVKRHSEYSLVFTFYDFYDVDRLVSVRDESLNQNLFRPHQIIVPIKDNEEGIERFCKLLQHMNVLTNVSKKSHLTLNQDEQHAFNNFTEKCEGHLKRYPNKSKQFVKVMINNRKNNSFSKQMLFKDIKKILASIGFTVSPNIVNNACHNVVAFCYSLAIKKFIYDPHLFFDNLKDFKPCSEPDSLPFGVQCVDNCTIHNLKGALLAECGVDLSKEDTVQEVAAFNLELLRGCLTMIPMDTETGAYELFET
ncbi:hypothetical protein DID76_00950 [Candidatus Marinamargulisbacteria bacterium SCGC AG-414-C22]|nr:hypothetical protein DID76_00950 [Candidatus Marinamargulisbacteria bacterium SCGC AG-414-C22]